MGATVDSPSPPAGASTPGGASAEELEALSASARGWHRIQLAVLGFIGFCGILWEGAAGTPSAVQYAGLVLIVAAFVLAVVSILVVGQVAHPVGDPAADAAEPAGIVTRRTRRLRRGIWGTYLAVALLVLATLSSWLPSDVADDNAGDGAPLAGGEDVVVVDVEDQSWCGEVIDVAEQVVQLRTAADTVEVRRDQIAVVHPVGSC